VSRRSLRELIFEKENKVVTLSLQLVIHDHLCSFLAKYFVFICLALYKIEGWYNRKPVWITKDYISVIIEEAKQISSNIELVSEGNLN
jgi:hypothetical protein